LRIILQWLQKASKKGRIISHILGDILEGKGVKLIPVRRSGISGTNKVANWSKALGKKVTSSVER